jgi:hypothetical protein
VWFQAEVFRKCKLELEVRCFPWRKFLTQIHSEVPLSCHDSILMNENNLGKSIKPSTGLKPNG